MKNPTEREISEAHSAMDWAKSACGIAANRDPAVALLFDEPELNPDRANVAKKLCIGCPILSDCLIYAIRYETPLGGNRKYLRADILMGGFTLRERQKMKQSPWWDKYYGDGQ